MNDVQHQQAKLLPPETLQPQSLLYIGKLFFISLEFRFGGGGGDIIKDEAWECEGGLKEVAVDRLFRTVVIVTPSP
jgi:hypothetical protein